jgi:dihydroorotate dehydrogenase (NAD+) catalytic subunit
MITFSNGKQYKYFIASGMMGFDGKGPTIAHKILFSFLSKAGLYDPSLFAITAKTITINSIRGPQKIRPQKDGWFNNYGLDNPGLNVFIEKYGGKIKEKNNLIISFAGKTKEQIQMLLITLLSEFPDILAFEFNVSCPNYIQIGTKEAIKICEHVKKNFDIDLLLKIGQGSNNYKMIAKETEGMVKALRINSVPLLEGGAVSGKEAQPTNWQIMEELISVSKTPVIAPSIWEYKDIEKAFKKGASGIDFGSVQMIHPQRPWAPILPTLWAKRYEKEQDKKDWYLKSCARTK